MIQYPEKAWDIMRDIFDVTIVDADGVRLFVKYEYCGQIETRGPKKALRKFYLCVDLYQTNMSRSLSFSGM